MASRAVLLLALSVLLALLVPAPAQGHGGIPISQQILWQGDTLFVPSKYWGVFYGRDGGPWRWICDEAINKNLVRRWALAGDGSFHVTDYYGITSSSDGGCTWVAATGEIALRSTSAVVADPADPARVWATTNAGPTLPWNALFSTHDGGRSWTASLTGDEYFHGVAISADGQRIYALGTPRSGDSSPRLHVSRDGGKAWSAVTLDYRLCLGPDSDGGAPGDMQSCFAPLQVVPVAVDPADAETLYLRIESEPVTVLLRATSDGKAGELLRTAGTVAQPGIGDLAWSGDGKRLYVATRDGMMVAAAGGAFTRTSSLSQAQCVSRHDDALYACTWNYQPDFAAVSRSDDAGGSFRKVFTFDQTVGPIDTCPAGTPVATICPDVWAGYAAQLGANTGGVAADLGSRGGGGGPDGCGCTLGGRVRGARSVDAAAAAAAAMLLIGIVRRRSAQRRRKASAPA